MNRNQVEEALGTIRSLRVILLRHIAALIGDYAGVHRSYRYFDILLGDWLDNFLHTLILASNLPRGSEVLLRSFEIPVAAEPLDYHRLSISEPDFLHRLKALADASRTAPALDKWEFQRSEVDIQLPNSSGGLGRIIGSLPAGRANVMIAYPVFRSARQDWLAGLWHLRKLARWNEPLGGAVFQAVVDSRWRRERASADYDAASPLESAAKALCVLLIPVSLLEGYLEFRRLALMLNRRRPPLIYTSTGLHHNSLFKLLLAEWQGDGTRLLVHQHGGGYGIDQLHALEDYEIGVCDRYFTWGWERPPFATEPLSPPPLPRNAFVKSEQILLVCTENPRFDFRLHFQPMSGTSERMIADIIDFSVVTTKHRKLVARLGVDRGWRIGERLRESTPAIEIDDGRQNVFSRYATSALVVHSYLGTSWLETLALNRPTLCFYDPETYAFRDRVEPYIQRLKNAGILHESGRSAAGFLVTLGSDLTGWWHSAEVQDARLQFVFHYARWSKDWVGDWQRAFEAEIEAAD